MCRYYVLKSIKGNNSVVYIPTDNEKLVAKMRPVLSTEEVYNLINEMPMDKCQWIEDDLKRKEAFHNIIAESNPQKLANLIRTIYIHQSELSSTGKKLHISDERFFKEAERILYNEFSLALDISSDSVPSFILSQIGSDNPESTD